MEEELKEVVKETQLCIKKEKEEEEPEVLEKEEEVKLKTAVKVAT